MQFSRTIGYSRKAALVLPVQRKSQLFLTMGKKTISSPSPSLVLLIIGYELIATFSGQQKCGRSQAAREQDDHAPADGTQIPGRVESPPGEETIVMIVEVSLRGRFRKMVSLYFDLRRSLYVGGNRILSKLW